MAAVKIGIDATSVWGLKDGLLNGMIAYTVHLVKGLIRNAGDARFVVFCRGEIPDVFAEETRAADFVALPETNRKILQQWALPRAARRHSPDVMFYPYNSAALFSPCPSVVTIHDLHPFVIKSRFRKIHDREQHGNTLASRINRVYWEKILRASCLRCTHTIAVSQATMNDIVEIFGISENRVSVVHEAVDRNRFNTNDDGVEREAFLRRYDLPDRYVLAVGTHAYKNIEGIVASFKRSIPRLPASFGLVIAGNKATLGAEVIDLVGDGDLAGRVRLTGFFPDADLKYLYQFADVFLFPSFYEGFGLPILEAFSCGVPVITSSKGALPEVSAGASVLVDPDNHDQISHELLSVIGDGSRRESLVQAGLERAAQFSWDTAATQTYAILAGLALK